MYLKVKNVIILICLIVLVAWRDNDPVKFDVAITVFTHGTYKLLSYNLTNEKILAIKYSYNNEPNKTLANRFLTDVEKKRVYEFMKKFPLEILKTEYVNRNVKGEIHRIFDIRINNNQKRILVYFHKQENLDALTDEINRLVPH